MTEYSLNCSYQHYRNNQISFICKSIHINETTPSLPHHPPPILLALLTPFNPSLPIVYIQGQILAKYTLYLFLFLFHKILVSEQTKKRELCSVKCYTFDFSMCKPCCYQRFSVSHLSVFFHCVRSASPRENELKFTKLGLVALEKWDFLLSVSQFSKYCWKNHGGNEKH